jgi:hypothetical protein
LFHRSDVRDTHLDGSRKRGACLIRQPCPEWRESEGIIPVEADLLISPRIIGPIPLNAIEIFRTDSRSLLARKEGRPIEILPSWDKGIFSAKKKDLLVLGEGPIFVS